MVHIGDVVSTVMLIPGIVGERKIKARVIRVEERGPWYIDNRRIVAYFLDRFTDQVSVFPDAFDNAATIVLSV